jgi:hypothetical protein
MGHCCYAQVQAWPSTAALGFKGWMIKVDGDRVSELKVYE